LISASGRATVAASIETLIAQVQATIVELAKARHRSQAWMRLSSAVGGIFSGRQKSRDSGWAAFLINRLARQLLLYIKDSPVRYYPQ
jgi:hypothetical protein